MHRAFYAHTTKSALIKLHFIFDEFNRSSQYLNIGGVDDGRETGIGKIDPV